MIPSNWIYAPFMVQSQTKADIQYPRNRRVEDRPPVVPFLLEFRRHLLMPETTGGTHADYRLGAAGDGLRRGTFSCLIISAIRIRTVFNSVIDIRYSQYSARR